MSDLIRLLELAGVKQKLDEVATQDMLGKTVQEIIDFANGKSNAYILKSMIYDLMVNDQKAIDRISTTDTQNDTRYKSYELMYDERIKKAVAFGKANGFVVNEDGVWTHFTRKGKDAGEHRKMYVSVVKTPDQVEKLPVLLQTLTAMLPRDVFFNVKMPYHFAMFYSHHDPIVIHFGSESLKPVFVQAVAKAGFNRIDRSTMNRSDFGRDGNDQSGKHASDSELVAQAIVQRIVKGKANLKNATPEQIKQTLLNAIKQETLNAAHRNHP
jgi:hypothetical protein